MIELQKRYDKLLAVGFRLLNSEIGNDHVVERI